MGKKEKESGEKKNRTQHGRRLNPQWKADVSFSGKHNRFQCPSLHVRAWPLRIQTRTMLCAVLFLLLPSRSPLLLPWKPKAIFGDAFKSFDTSRCVLHGDWFTRFEWEIWPLVGFT